jgi:hypothetical protein
MKEVWKSNETSKKPKNFMTFKKMTECKQQSTFLYNKINQIHQFH